MSQTTTPSPHPLDAQVNRVGELLEERGVIKPKAFLWLGTGEGQLPEALDRHTEISLGELGMPGPWAHCRLHCGRIGALPLWLLEDRSGDPSDDQHLAPWVNGLPAWLAVRAGACVLLHTTAGSALVDDSGPRAPVGGIGLVLDHLNLSGSTPLIGLGSSALGPLFPDLTTLHHIGLRRRAIQRAEQLGIVAREVIAACTPGPALETPAERRLFGCAGADVAVQSLQWPVLSAAHAGLAMLSIVAISDAADGPTDVAALVETAGLQATQLDDLILSLIPDLEEAARVRAEEV